MSGSGVRRVAVVGAGTMGGGIAQLAAWKGFEVALQDVIPGGLERAIARIRENLEKGVAKGKVSPEEPARILDRIRAVPDLDGAVAGADLVVEAIPEVLAEKQVLFRRLGGIAAPAAILATNTSSLPVGEIGSAASRPERTLGLHFFNPPYAMPLVEIVRSSATSDATVERALAFVRELGKEPIVVRDAPGFATSRLGVALGLEAMRIVEEGVASAEDVDRAMRLGYGHPMGPLALTDLVGLDVRLSIAEHLARTLGPRFEPPAILRKLVEDGRFGRKTGEGFYRYPE
jgi:3-hydroxybutyryl-CoA dehydrogenase